MERVKEFEPSISTLAKLCKTTNWLKSNNLKSYYSDFVYKVNQLIYVNL